MELFEYTASELSGMLRTRSCSARELVQSALGRIETIEKQIGAFVTVTGEQALKHAAEIDRRRAAGETLHDLAGIPVAVKDNICTRAVRTTCSSRMLSGFVPPYDSAVMERLANCGAVMIGKTNMDEFAMGSSTETSYFKKTRNPWSLARVPGGSSGGSAAAVAAGESVLSLGSDTGGSIRLPASFCGIVGLKPTYGAVSRYGLIAFASSFDQIGPMGRSVTDAAMLYQAICGWDQRDTTSVRRNSPDYTVGLAGGVKGRRIGIPKEYYGEGVSDAVKERIRDVAVELEAQGAVLREISLPGTEHALRAYYIISSAEASSNLARYDGTKYGHRAGQYQGLSELYRKSRSEGFGEEVKRRILLGTFVLSSGYYDDYYKRAKLLQRSIASEFGSVFHGCDLVLTPTAPDTAFHFGDKNNSPIEMYATDCCTVAANIAGLPALSIPAGKDSSGMPIGVQLIGPKFSESMLFQTAYAWEKAAGGWNCLPALGKEETG